MGYRTTNGQARFVEMGRAKEALRKELLDLDPADRAAVAEDALRSLDGTAYGELSPAWEDEIKRRSRAVDDGSAESEAALRDPIRSHVLRKAGKTESDGGFQIDAIHGLL